MFDEVVFIGKSIIHTNEVGISLDMVQAVTIEKIVENGDFPCLPKLTKADSANNDWNYLYSSLCPTVICCTVTLFSNTTTMVTLSLDLGWLGDVGFDLKGEDSK